MLSLPELIAGRELTITRLRDAISRAIDRLPLGSHSRRHLPISLVNEERANQQCQTRGKRPSDCPGGPNKSTGGLGRGPVHARCCGSTPVLTAADTAVAHMSLNQQCSRRRQSPGSIRIHEPPHVAAVL